MFQLSKKTIIFLVIFSAILFGITVAAIIYSKNNDTNGLSEIIIEPSNKTSNNSYSKPIDDGVKGIDLNDTYSINDLKFKKIEYVLPENQSFVIKYFQISGLRNEAVQNAINKEIKDGAFNFFNDLKNKANVKSINVYADCYGSFADVLSLEISGGVSYKNDSYDGVFYKGYNYRLDTGDKIEFNELFTYDASVRNIIYNGVYNSLAWNYYFNELEKRGYEDSLTMDDIDYSDIEDQAYKVVNNFYKQDDKIFYFNEKKIFIVYDNKSYEIDMMDNYKNISIYNRFKSDNSLYNDNFIKMDNLPVLAKMFNGIYGYYNKGDNYIVEISLSDAEMADSYMELINKKVEEIKKEANDTGKCILYFESVYFDDEKDGKIACNRGFEKYISTKDRFKKDIIDKMLERRRDTVEAPQEGYYFFDENINSDFGHDQIFYDVVSKKFVEKDSGSVNLSDNEENQDNSNDESLDIDNSFDDDSNSVNVDVNSNTNINNNNINNTNTNTNIINSNINSINDENTTGTQNTTDTTVTDVITY